MISKKKILEKWPNFFHVDGYYINKSHDHILSGFCLEKTQFSMYVWKFMYPLFEPGEGLHLTYSSRIGFLEKGDDTLERLDELLLSEGVVAFSNLSILDFVALLKNRESGLNNDFVRRAVVLGLALIGKNQEALDAAYPLLEGKAYSYQEPFRESVDLIIAKLKSRDDFSPLIDNWEAINKKQLIN